MAIIYLNILFIIRNQVTREQNENVHYSGAGIVPWKFTLCDTCRVLIRVASACTQSRLQSWRTSATTDTPPPPSSDARLISNCGPISCVIRNACHNLLDLFVKIFISIPNLLFGWIEPCY